MKQILVPRELTTKDREALMGKFSIKFPEYDDQGNEYVRNINVPWVTIEEIYKAAIKHFEKEK